MGILSNIFSKIFPAAHGQRTGWHRQVMNKVAANGGRVPANLKD
ncbi:hypothetical protein WKW80_11720 [Variovorax humicola]|uniref:Uncharacterized protein n=1 Tax=Variovorax humicola TaxID=1769758 RepID=A0ABU8VY04_9BURK